MADDGGITSPEGVLMLIVATVLDGIGLIILCFALDDFWILDATGLIVIGGWAFFKSGTIQMTKGAQKIGKRFLLSIGIEVIPWLGGLVPCWTWLIWKEMSGMSASTKTVEDSDENSEEKATPKSIISNTESNQEAKQETPTTAA